MNLKNLSIKVLFALLAWLVIFNSVVATESNSNLHEQAFKKLQEFCQAEFMYSLNNRYDLIKMSPSYEDRLEKLTGTSIGTLYIPDAYEIFAVKAYKILNVEVIDNNNAVVTVSYDVVAKRTGWKPHNYANGTYIGEPIFVKFLKPNYIEKIYLTFDNKTNRWWIIDPPFPKISIYKIIAFLEERINRSDKYHPEFKVGKSYPGPQTSYNADKRNLELLKSLR